MAGSSLPGRAGLAHVRRCSLRRSSLAAPLPPAAFVALLDDGNEKRVPTSQSRACSPARSLPLGASACGQHGRSPSLPGNCAGNCSTMLSPSSVQWSMRRQSESCFRHRVPCPTPSSAYRLTAGASGFLNLSQSGDLPDRSANLAASRRSPPAPSCRRGGTPHHPQGAPFRRTPGQPLRSDAGDGRLADLNGLAPQVRAGYLGGRGESRIGTN